MSDTVAATTDPCCLATGRRRAHRRAHRPARRPGPDSDSAPNRRFGLERTARQPGTPRTISTSGQNRPVDLARIGWIVTVLACLVAVLILILQAYYGYALVTFAVAVSAAFNLT